MDNDYLTHQKLDSILAALGAVVIASGSVLTAPTFFSTVGSATKPELSWLDASGALVGTAGIVIKGAAGRLYVFDVMNVSGAVIFAMFFNKAAAPVNGDSPVWTVPLAATSGRVFADIPGGRFLGNGIGLAFSSTSTTLTLLGANGAKYTVGYS